jgi:DNA-binding response OmpR family regulator
VLIVEDDAGIATQLVRGLTRGGYAVDHVMTGGEALTWGDPDVVLLDLELPDGDGVQVCRKLRERSSAGIIVITAHGEEPDRARQRERPGPDGAGPAPGPGRHRAGGGGRRRGRGLPVPAAKPGLAR